MITLDDNTENQSNVEYIEALLQKNNEEFVQLQKVEDLNSYIIPFRPMTTLDDLKSYKENYISQYTELAESCLLLQYKLRLFKQDKYSEQLVHLFVTEKLPRYIEFVARWMKNCDPGYLKILDLENTIWYHMDESAKVFREAKDWEWEHGYNAVAVNEVDSTTSYFIEETCSLKSENKKLKKKYKKLKKENKKLRKEESI